MTNKVKEGDSDYTKWVDLWMENLAVLGRAEDHTNEQRRNEFEPHKHQPGSHGVSHIPLKKTLNIFVLSTGA